MLPAIVIGIGGTGKWVVTHLKYDIMSANDGKVSDNVALLSFDLAAQETPAIEILTFRFDEGKKDHFTIDFSQSSREFLNFSGFWARPIFSIDQGQGSGYPFIYQWLKEDDAKAYSLSRGELDNRGAPLRPQHQLLKEPRLKAQRYRRISKSPRAERGLHDMEVDAWIKSFCQ